MKENRKQFWLGLQTSNDTIVHRDETQSNWCSFSQIWKIYRLQGFLEASKLNLNTQQIKSHCANTKLKNTHPYNVSNLQFFPRYRLPPLILQDIYKIVIYRHVVLKTLLLYMIKRDDQKIIKQSLYIYAPMQTN